MLHATDGLRSTTVISTLLIVACYGTNINICVRLRLFLKHPVHETTVVNCDEQPVASAT
jgi:hypothetical protein